MNTTVHCYETLEKNVKELYDMIDNIKDTSSTILISGPSGSGKEAICRLIHDKRCPDNEAPYIAINCSAIPDTLIESELFGHEAGSFTGATTENIGKLEMAGTGTIVLDEITELDLKTQAKLLRVLESREFYRIGGSTPIKLQAQILATTNKNMKTALDSGKFRPDLFYRLDILRLAVPSLNERRKDIPLLTDFFLDQLNEENERSLKLSPEVYHFICQKTWEGNIRELKNFITRLFYLSQKDLITIQDVSEKIVGAERSASPFIITNDSMSLYEMEKKYILHTLKKMEGNKSKTARTLKISLKTLRNKLKDYDYENIDPAIAKLARVVPLQQSRSQ